MNPIQEEIDRWNSFEECLLHRVSSSDGLYSLELEINSIRERDAEMVRSNILERPLIVTLRIEAVSGLQMHGDVPPGVLTAPDRVNWGYSEFAQLTLEENSSRIRLRLAWEAQRTLVIDGARVTISY